MTRDAFRNDLIDHLAKALEGWVGPTEQVRYLSYRMQVAELYVDALVEWLHEQQGNRSKFVVTKDRYWIPVEHLHALADELEK